MTDFTQRRKTSPITLDYAHPAPRGIPTTVIFAQLFAATGLAIANYLHRRSSWYHDNKLLLISVIIAISALAVMMRNRRIVGHQSNRMMIISAFFFYLIVAVCFNIDW